MTNCPTRLFFSETQHWFQKKKKSLREFCGFLKMCFFFVFTFMKIIEFFLINFKQIEILSKMIFLILSELLFLQKKNQKEAACPPKRYPYGQKKIHLKSFIQFNCF
jgi:hypothetical protein